MTEPTTDQPSYPYHPFGGQNAEVNSRPLRQIELSNPEKDEGQTILLNIETKIKELVSALAKRDIELLNKIGIENIKVEEINALPTSITGVIIHFLVEGIGRDFNIKFDKKPKSLKIGNAKGISNLKERKRMLTRDQKNELLEQTKMSYYDKDLTLGLITKGEVFEKIEKAYNGKKSFEGAGLILPESKTKYPEYVGVDYKTPDKDKLKEKLEAEEEIISTINQKIIELATQGLISLPKQEKNSISKRNTGD